ncbi:MAG: hypothetical protein ABJO01_13105 [Parasphingorhabdus sp.]|uniref:hypothetical protein n=1 Tax=Parasphingorhabdus sp. TaxID=2709688 RepID=UPI003297EC01
MQTGKPDILDRMAQIVVGIVGIFALIFGLFMIISPLEWYTAIPTVITTGPPNKHFIRDIGIAYVSCGIILLYASANIHMRWMAALAGGLWLSLHGILHIYEVSVGVCSPAVFVADAPGVLGPPVLVLIAVASLFVRQRIVPAGIPDRLFLTAVDRMSPDESAYLHEISGAPGNMLEKFKHFMPASNHRYEASAELLSATRIGAVLIEDCGPCAITAAQGALAEGLSRDEVNAMLAGKLTGSTELAFEFGQAIAQQSEEADALGIRIEQQFGRPVRRELAMAAAMVRAYPAMKRGLGLTTACSLTPLRV